MRRPQWIRGAVVGAGVLLVVATAVSAVAGQTGFAVAGLSLVLGLLGVVLIDLRRRAADLAHMLRLAAARHKKLESQILEFRGVVEEVGSREVLARVEAAERRVLGVYEADRLRADRDRLRAERQHGLVEGALGALSGDTGAISTKVGQLEKRTAKESDRVQQVLGNVTRAQTRDVEALLQLMPRIAPRAPLPPTGNWALDPGSMLHLADLVARERPQLVVELGSGTSTVWLGYLLEAHGGRLVSIDHSEEYALLTKESLARHSLLDHVDVRTAPLMDVDIDGQVQPWYSVGAFEDLERIDLLLIDGPPKATGEQARFPALPILSSRLSAGACVVLDDSDRPDEAAILERWATGLPEWSVVPGDFSRLAVLRRSAS